LRATLNPYGAGSGYGGPGLLSRATLALLFAAVTGSGLIVLMLADRQLAFTIVAAFGLVVALVVSGNPRLFSLWCLLLVAPLGIKKAFLPNPHMGGASGITIDGADIFLAILLLFILRDVNAGRWTLRFARPVVICWGVMIALGLLDILFGPMRSLAILEVVRMLKCYLLFFVIINEIVRAQQFMHAVAAICCGIVMQGVITIIQWFYKANLHLQFLGEPAAVATTTATKGVYLGTVDIYRAGGLFEHPNLLAGYLAILLPICIALLFSRISPLAKAALAAVVVLGLVALVITLSRSGWISFAAGFVVLFLFSMLHQRLRLRYVLARVLVIIGLVAALSLASGDIVRRFTASDPGAVQFRWDMIYAAFDMVMDRPVLGVGLNTFVAHFPQYANPPGREAVNAKYGDLWPVVHNSYLVTWSEQGTIGFALLIGLYGCVLWTGLRTARYMLDDRLFALNLGACCGVVAIMVDGLSSFFIDESASERVFFMVVGLIFALNYWTEANRPRARVRPAPRTPGAVGISNLDQPKLSDSKAGDPYLV
jgi:putative inorganic carbon (HCO3(-)) transporter